MLSAYDPDPVGIADLAGRPTSAEVNLESPVTADSVDILELARKWIPGAREEIERDGGMLIDCQDHTLELLEEACEEIERLRAGNQRPRPSDGR
jgi:hypothetical protein